MSDADPTETLTGLVESWLAGFGVSRAVAVRRAGAIVEVDVAAESRRLELVAVEPDRAVLAAIVGRLVDTTDVWATVLTSEPRSFDLPAGVRTALEGEVLMTLDLTAAAVPLQPATRVVVAEDGDRAFATVTIGDVVAANGQVAVVGTDAIVDRVRTHDDHQRQGLGTDVMTALTTWAAGRGATRGILAASVEGQALYRRLGWGVAGAMVTLAALPSDDQD